MRSSLTSISDRSALILRAHRLAELMLSDPSRPWYLVEYALLLTEIADAFDLILDTIGDSSALADRVSSLETRYSELLYCLKTK